VDWLGAAVGLGEKKPHSCVVSAAETTAPGTASSDEKRVPQRRHTRKKRRLAGHQKKEGGGQWGGEDTRDIACGKGNCRILPAQCAGPGKREKEEGGNVSTSTTPMTTARSKKGEKRTLGNGPPAVEHRELFSSLLGLRVRGRKHWTWRQSTNTGWKKGKNITQPTRPKTKKGGSLKALRPRSERGREGKERPGTLPT